MAGKRWSKEEDELLIKVYQSTKLNELLRIFPNRTWEALKIRAMKLKLKRGQLDKRESDLSVLLLDTPLTYYWIGLIFADGSFVNNGLSIGLHLNDKEHIIKLSKYLNCDYSEDKKRKMVHIKCMDNTIVPKIMNKFDLKERKTYNPPNTFKQKTDDLFISLLAGFIDGDGHIRKQFEREDAQIVIKCHSSWLGIFNEIEDEVYRISKIERYNKKTSKINKQGYAFITFSNNLLLSFLKKKVKELGLPAMERKWSLIDESKVGKYQRARYYEQEYLRLKDKYSQYRIAKILGLNNSTITAIKKRLQKREV